MSITVIKMSYLIAGRFVAIAVKTKGKGYDLYLNGVPVDQFRSAPEAVLAGMQAAQELAIEEGLIEQA